MMCVTVEIINLEKRTAILSDGSVLTINEMFDSDGDATDEPSEAATATAPSADGWWAIDVSEFDFSPAH